MSFRIPEEPATSHCSGQALSAVKGGEEFLACVA